MIKVTGADGIKYIIDGERYWPEEALKEALGCKDDDIFGEIKKLKEERDNLKDNLRITEHALKTVKKERDQLKEKCDKLKARANAAYGVSCGYSEYTGDKAPTFLCNVISYSWNFGALEAHSLRARNDSIRVELDLTPTANYKGAFDMEDLKRYIQAYGREKKLGIVESVDYKNAKTARAELAYLYKKVLGKDRLDRDLSSHEAMKAIHDEYKRVRDSQLAFSQSLQSVYMHVYEGTGYKTSDIYAAPDKLADWIITRYDSTKKLSHMETLCDTNDHIDELCDKYTIVQPNRESTTKERLDYIFSVLAEHREKYNSEWKRVEKLIKEKRAAEDSLAELRAKIREIYRSVVDDEWNSPSYNSALNDINEEYKKVIHNFEERTEDWSKVRQEYSRYRLAVGSLLGIPKEARDDINAIDRSFNSTKKAYESLKEFRDNVCEIFDIPSSMADNYIKEIHDVVDRYNELEDFRVDICGALDIEGMLGTPQQNDKYILEQVEKLRNDGCKPTVFRNDVAKAVGMTVKDSDLSDIVNRVMEIRNSHDKLARLRSNICTALCLGHEDCDGNIIGRIHMLQDCHDKLCKDYTELRKAIWEAMDRKPETLPEDDARLAGEVRMLAENEKLLLEFRDAVAEAIGITYSTTNNFILKQVTDIYKGYGQAQDKVIHLTRLYNDVSDKYSATESKFREQFNLRQQWHAKYESEHERANGVQKCLDKTREALRVKDISLETARKQYEKVCGNLDTAQAAVDGFKKKVRELQAKVAELEDEKSTEEEHPIYTDPGYLRRGEEGSEEE